ncbi:hypothetical protein QBC34DRAFT_472363 [Podospora aff. communis PSN243]|uniref:SET domain-containing protein n=1 Tax=Podospora aff. communis PSN243 TaxID=3040156 RepID=A0AAV9GBJ5_9PEZI|nr:hypothetical protein QBC34DRAFT_472363 [Podospora aff. communis PSN243]
MRPPHNPNAASALLLLTLPLSTALPSPNQSPNYPPGRLAPHPQTCPLPGHLGIIPSLPSLIPWSHAPKCTTATNTTRLDCLFSSSTFRNGHGISIITSTTTMSNLVSVSAFDDRPAPLAAAKREALGPTYKITPVEGKGLGLIATRKIKRGEIIMVDYPAVLMSMEYLASSKAHHRRRLMRKAMEQLPGETREGIDALQRGKGGHEVDRIFGVNTYTVGMEGGLYVGLFLGVARINHSCRPNAYYRFHGDRLTVEIVSHSAIEPGDEILINYTPTGMPHTDRRRFLHENWDIDCSCSLCRANETTISDSEAARKQMDDLRETMMEARTNKFYKDAITIANDWMYYCEFEGLSPLQMELWDILADLNFLRGDLDNAIRYARMALDGWVKLGSVDDTQLENAREMVMKLWKEAEERVEKGVVGGGVRDGKGE